MKICFLTNTVFKFGGQERIVSVISNGLIERGFDVSIMYTDTKTLINRSLYNLNSKVNLIPVYGYESKYSLKRIMFKLLKIINRKSNVLLQKEKLLEDIYYKRDKKLNKNIIELINRKKFDVVIGVAGEYSILLAILKEKLNCKVYGWQHNCYEAYFETPNRYYWHQKEVFKKRLKNLDKYIVLTNSDKNKMDKNFNINSIVLNNARTFVSNEKTKLNNKVFLTLGRLEEAKGYDLLLESFKIFAQKNKDWKLNIVGDGSKKEFIVNKIKEYNLEDRIILHPFTTNVKEYMINSSVFLFPSKWEGFGLVVVEAFECGLPVISYNLDPVVEIIDDNINGILVKKFDEKNFADSMLKIISNKKELRRMSIEATKKAEKYSIDNIIKQWIEKLNWIE